MARRCRAVWLGRIGYREAADLQETCARALKAAQDGGPAAAESLFLLEHPPVITLGRNAQEADVLADAPTLRARGVTIERANRGGQVTYHGPGQLVGYPILDLHPDRRDVGRYLRDLEEVLIRTLAHLGIASGRQAEGTGVWAGGAKIAALGVHLSRWVTTHGFALNVTTDLTHFDLIVPCGIRTRGVTSIARLLGRPVTFAEVVEPLVAEFGARFGREMVAGDEPARDGLAPAAARRADPARAEVA